MKIEHNLPDPILEFFEIVHFLEDMYYENIKLREENKKLNEQCKDLLQTLRDGEACRNKVIQDFINYLAEK